MGPVGVGRGHGARVREASLLYRRAREAHSENVREEKVREEKVREDKVREDKVREGKVREDKVREEQSTTNTVLILERYLGCFNSSKVDGVRVGE